MKILSFYSCCFVNLASVVDQDSFISDWTLLDDFGSDVYFNSPYKSSDEKVK